MGDQDRDELIMEHLETVTRIAKRMYRKLPKYIEVDELISIGRMSLMDAFYGFRKEEGVKFKTYLELRVKGAIFDYLRGIDSAPRSLRKKGRKLENTYIDLKTKLDRDVTDEEISDEMGISTAKFNKLVKLLQNHNIGNFRQTYFRIKKSQDLETQLLFTPALLPGVDSLVGRIEIKEILLTLIDTLPKYERAVILMYYYEELTMKEIGKILGRNESRVSQLHTGAIGRLRIKLAKRNIYYMPE